MNVLVIEDDPNKLTQIKEFITRNEYEFNVEEAHSYQSGLKKALELRPDIVLLDMSLPTYDVSVKEKGGRPRSFGGRDILCEMRRKNIKSKAIVVTQFEDFQDEKESKNLDALKAQLLKEFKDNYAGAVFYQPSGIEWESELKDIIEECMSGIGEKDA